VTRYSITPQRCEICKAEWKDNIHTPHERCNDWFKNSLPVFAWAVTFPVTITLFEYAQLCVDCNDLGLAYVMFVLAMHMVINFIGYKVVTILTFKSTFTITWLCHMWVYIVETKTLPESVDLAMWSIAFVDFAFWFVWVLLYVVNDIVGNN